MNQMTSTLVLLVSLAGPAAFAQSQVACQGLPMSISQAKSHFEAGGSTAPLAHVNAAVYKRRCNTVTNCGAWQEGIGVSTSHFLLNSPATVSLDTFKPGEIFISLTATGTADGSMPLMMRTRLEARDLKGLSVPVLSSSGTVFTWESVSDNGIQAGTLKYDHFTLTSNCFEAVFKAQSSVSGSASYMEYMYIFRTRI